jgi:hypothetical protein
MYGFLKYSAIVPTDNLPMLKKYLNSFVSEDESDRMKKAFSDAGEKRRKEHAEIAKQIHEFREKIEKQYRDTPTGGGGSFGELLCWEIHSNGQTFLWLAEKWGISVMFLGEVIADHCNRLDSNWLDKGKE